MPSSKNDEQFWTEALHHATDLDSIENHGSGQKGNAETQAVLYLVGNGAPVIQVERAIDNTWLVTGLPQRTGQAEKPQRRSEEFPCVRRKKQHDLSGASCHAVPI